jgi:predicted regulator of Ras-like GTPase activity (Roadblock/LC7/MglB family)
MMAARCWIAQLQIFLSKPIYGGSSINQKSDAWIQMSELSPVRSALDEIKKQDHVLDASLVSRGGMYVMGGPIKGIHRETFAAMSAIILGAAETTSTELKDKLNKVSIELTEQNLVLIGIGPKYLVAIMMDQEGDQDKVANMARDLMSRVESIL